VAEVRVQIEVGGKRTFATAVDWPGWSRSARDAAGAVEALLEYGARYKRSIGAAANSLTVPRTVKDLRVVKSVKGGSGTDFGVPSSPLLDDDVVPSATELQQLVAIVRGAWRAFDRAVAKGTGKQLTTGPRGGGRSLEKIRDHQLEADVAYVKAIGGTLPAGADAKVVRAEMVDALGARARAELPDRGPRGGARWSARYAAHRTAWHALDHAWEIEDRLG
jgi:hypothetical protein